MTTITISARDNLPECLEAIGALSTRHGPFIMRRSMNNVATAAAKAGNAKIAAVIDRPINRTKTAVKVFKGVSREDAKAGRFEAIINVYDGRGFDITDARVLASGKSSVMPNRYLSAQIEGGVRINKRFENALIKAGVMPPGMQAVFAKRSGYLDQYGNLSGARINQILAWFKAFPETGYRANLTDRSRQAATFGRKNKRTVEVSFGKGRKYGYAYFVSAGERYGGLQMRLPPGVWERNYPNGPAGKSFIKPVLLFIKPGTYRKRFPFYETMQSSIASLMPRELQAAAEFALRTAR